MPSVTIPYGDSEISIEIPERNLLACISPNVVTPVSDPVREIRRSLLEPIGMAPLKEAAVGSESVLIVADDMTRSTPVDLILPPLLDEFNEAGVSDDRITVMIALGTHRLMTDQEIQARFGNVVTERVAVVNSPWQQEEELVDLGKTDNGTPIQIARQAIESDFVIGVGNVIPHHLVGFAGGAKIIQPGISGSVTTGETHHLSTKTRHSYLGIVENPVRREMEDIAKRVGLSAILNVVLDSTGALVKAFYGDFREAFRAGVEVSRQVYGVGFPEQADIVIAGSHPCDLEMWQAHKTLYAADVVVKDGGTIIEVAPCYEGISVSHPDVLEYLKNDAAEIGRKLEHGEVENVVAAAVCMAWARMRERVDIALISEGIGEEDTRALGFYYFEGVQEALAAALNKHGDDATVIVMTHAPEMLPILRE